MGTTGRLARWDGILEYFGILATRSARIRVDTLGPTTLGNPFVVITMSSPENLRRVDAQSQRDDGRVCDPRQQPGSLRSENRSAVLSR